MPASWTALVVAISASLPLVHAQSRLRPADEVALFATAGRQLSIGLPTIVDLDGDGRAELTSTLGILRVDVAGAWRRVQAWPDEVTGVRAVAGDLDGDGDEDLVVFDVGTSVLRNDRGVGLTNVSAVRADVDVVVELPGAIDVELADVDGDLDSDVLLVDTRGDVRLFRNDGAFAFVEWSGLLPSTVGPFQRLTALDPDGDGDLDLVVTGASRAELWRNDGAAGFVVVAGLPTTFGSATRFGDEPLVGDVNGDGFDDVLLGGIAWHAAPGPTFVTAGTTSPVPTWVPRALVDGDGDGALDVWEARAPSAAPVTFDAASRLRPNDGSGRFTGTAAVVTTNAAANDGSRHLVVGDLDGDGDADALDVSWRRDGGLRLAVGDGSGAFRTLVEPRYPTFVVGSLVGAVDVDRDLDVDLVESERTAQNRGGGTFDPVPQAWAAIASTITAAALGDVDGDGDPDAVFGTIAARPSVWWRNDGSGMFASVPQGFANVSTTVCGALVDVDGDGDLDWFEGNDGQDRLWLNRGAGGAFVLGTGRVPTSFEPTRQLEPFDADGDGDVDVFVIGDLADRLLLNDGLGRFVSAPTGTVPVRPGSLPASAVDAADVDADGDLDLVLSGRLLENGSGGGGGAFTDVSTARLPAGVLWTDQVVVDIDDDGDVDIVAADVQAGLRVLANDGAGAFVDATGSVLAPSALSAARVVGLLAVDIDGDGDVDLVADSRSARVVFVNHTRQLRVTSTAGIGGRLTLECELAADVARGGGRWVVPAIAPTAGGGLVVPGIGVFVLDPTTAVSGAPRPVGRGPGAAVVADVSVPPTPSLHGVDVFGQALVIGSALRLTNAVRATLW